MEAQPPGAAGLQDEMGAIMARSRDGLHRRERGILAFSYRDERDVWRERYTGTRDRAEARKFRKAFPRWVVESNPADRHGGLADGRCREVVD